MKLKHNFLLLCYFYLCISFVTPVFWLGSFLTFGQKLKSKGRQQYVSGGESSTRKYNVYHRKTTELTVDSFRLSWYVTFNLHKVWYLLINRRNLNIFQLIGANGTEQRIFWKLKRRENTTLGSSWISNGWIRYIKAWWCACKIFWL